MKAKLGILLAIVLVVVTIAPVLGAPGIGSLVGSRTPQAIPTVPAVMNYQGRLTDAAGSPVTGSYAVTFSLYTAPTGGTSLWSENQTVIVNNGLFDTFLGTQIPLTPDLFTGSSYLGVKVGADAEMTPRQRLGSVPYAFIAERARTLDIPLAIQLSYNGNLLELTNPTGGVLRAQGQGTAIDATSSGGQATMNVRNEGTTHRAIVAQSKSALSTIFAQNEADGTAIQAWSRGDTQPTIDAENWQGGGAIVASNRGNDRPSIFAVNFGQSHAIKASSNGTQPTVLVENSGTSMGPALTARSQESRRGEATVLLENTGSSRAVTVLSRGVNDPAMRVENINGGAISANGTGEYRPVVDVNHSANGLALSATSRGIEDIQKKEANATIFASNTGGGIAIGARSASGLFGTIRSNNTGMGPAVDAVGNGPFFAAVMAKNEAGGPALRAETASPIRAAVQAWNTGNVTEQISSDAPALDAQQFGNGVAVRAENTSFRPTIRSRNYGMGLAIEAVGRGDRILSVRDSTTDLEVFHVMGNGGGAMSWASSPLQPALMGTHEGSNNGVFGSSKSGTGGHFENDARNAYSLVAQNRAGGMAFMAVGGANVLGDVSVTGNGVFTGNLAAANLKTAVVDTESYGRRLLYAMESPTVVFEDFGTAALAGGSARVEMEPIFLQTVNTGLPYQVFLTPLGDSRGLYVAEKGHSYFIVRESGGGTAGISFDYRIVAKRKGHEGVRLQEAPASMQAQAGR